MKSTLIKLKTTERFKSRWQTLAEYLGYKKQEIECIQQDYHNTNERMYRVLNILFQKHYLEIDAIRALYGALWYWLNSTKETNQGLINNLKETMEMLKNFILQ